MTTVQSKFFRVLTERAEEEGMEVAVAYEYSNRGLLHLQEPDSFETSLSLYFDFQPCRVSFVAHPVSEAPPIFHGKPNPYSMSFTAGELDEAITTILAAAKEEQ